MHSRSWLLKIAVFLIPGSLFLVYFCVNFPVVKEKVVQLLWEEPEITHWVLVGLVCLIAGSLIDFLRTTLTSLVQWIEGFGKENAGFFDELRIADGLTGRTYTYPYLALNISLSIFVAWGFSFFHSLEDMNTFKSAFSTSVRSFERELLAAALLAVFTLGISYWIAYRAISKLNAAAPQNKKCEGDA